MKAIDGKDSTKWCDTPVGPLVISFPVPVHVHYYTYRTGNDAPERDPVEWRLQGSMDNENWANLSHVQTAPPDARDTLLPLFALGVRLQASLVLRDIIPMLEDHTDLVPLIPD